MIGNPTRSSSAPRLGYLRLRRTEYSDDELQHGETGSPRRAVKYRFSSTRTRLGDCGSPEISRAALTCGRRVRTLRP